MPEREGQTVVFPPSAGRWPGGPLGRIALWTVLAVVVLHGWGHEYSLRSTTIRLMAARVPGGPWQAVRGPGAVEAVHLEVVVEDREGRGWSTRTVRSMHYFDHLPAAFSWEDGYALALEKMDAGDPAVRVEGFPLSAVERRAVLEELRTRAKASGATWSMDEPDMERVTGWLWKWVWGRAWVVPAVVLVSLPFIAMVRAARGPTLRAKIGMLRRGTCPTCRYSREGFAVEDPCPECGTTLKGLEEEYRRVAGRARAEG